jgi:hypothetical protein
MVLRVMLRPLVASERQQRHAHASSLHARFVVIAVARCAAEDMHTSEWLECNGIRLLSTQLMHCKVATVHCAALAGP